MYQSMFGSWRQEKRDMELPGEPERDVIRVKLQRRRNLSMIAMDSKVIWEKST